MAGRVEIASTIGENNKVIKNKNATTKEVSPVRPPTATPDVDSTYALDGVDPNVAPTVVAIASAVSAAFALGNFPSFIKFACSATPIIVPVVSKIVTSKNAKITVYKEFENTPVISKSKNTIVGGADIILSTWSMSTKNPITAVINIPINNAPLT